MALTEHEAPELDAAQVAAFLRRNPGFLVENPDLIPAVPTPDGATSLVQRQMATLREHNRDVDRRLQQAQTVAADNERIFSAAGTLTFALMDVQTRAELNDALATHVLARFDLDHLICFEDGGSEAPLQHLRCIQEGDPPPVATLFDVRLPLCNPCRPEEYEELFGERPNAPGSAALVPVRFARVEATLALGSRDPGRYTPDLGTEFLGYLGDLVARVLARLRLVTAL